MIKKIAILAAALTIAAPVFAANKVATPPAARAAQSSVPASHFSWVKKTQAVTPKPANYWRQTA